MEWYYQKGFTKQKSQQSRYLSYNYVDFRIVIQQKAHQNDSLVGRFSIHLSKVICSDYQLDDLDTIS